MNPSRTQLTPIQRFLFGNRWVFPTLLLMLIAIDQRYFSHVETTRSALGMQLAIGFVVLIVIAGIAGVAYVFYLQKQEEMHRQNQTLSTPEGSRFEQILAEIQGINLAIQNGSGHQFSKIKRLARIFIERIGVEVTPGMTFDALQDALVNASLSPKQIQMLSSILDRCERGEVLLEDEKPDFDPLDLIKDFKYIIGQIEGRSYVE